MAASRLLEPTGLPRGRLKAQLQPMWPAGMAGRKDPGEIRCRAARCMKTCGSRDEWRAAPDLEDRLRPQPRVVHRVQKIPHGFKRDPRLLDDLPQRGRPANGVLPAVKESRVPTTINKANEEPNNGLPRLRERRGSAWVSGTAVSTPRFGVAAEHDSAARVPVSARTHVDACALGCARV
jgi:hypothetical protein